jgi:quaternary ammonium compound-resistance protein SugE
MKPLLVPWLLVAAAGALEIVWAIGFKYAWHRGWGWKAACVVSVTLSLVLLLRALQDLPAGTAYAVWMGIGAAGVAILGIVVFGESAHPLRLAFIAMIAIGVIGLALRT